MIKRVLLVNPPDTRPPDMLADRVRIGMVPPLGLGYIAAVLEQQGIEVKILDCVAEGWGEVWPHEPLLPRDEVRYGLNDFEIGGIIAKYEPDLVGVSCLFSNKAFDAHNVCRIAKMVDPNIVTVMGGAHPTALPEETLEDENVDYVVKGEGEWALNELVKAEFVKVDSCIMHIIIDGGSDRPYLPLPARHLLPMDKYLSGQSPHSGQKRTPATTISTSRGCPGRCTFCAIRGMWGEAYRTRSPKNVLAEIEHLINTYHIKELHFEDDNLTADKRRAMAIFQGIIDRKLDLTLNSPSGLAIFALDEELLDKMREAGFYSVSFAIESGVPRVLKDLMHKHVDLAKAKQLAAHARSLGMKVKAFFILGYPGETKDDMKRTIDYAANMGIDWALFFVATPLPGTELLKTCQENGYLVDPNLDYRYSFFKANIRTPEFDPDYVEALKEWANKTVNFDGNYNVRVGAFDRARQDFQEVLNLYPNLEMAKEGLRRVDYNV